MDNGAFLYGHVAPEPDGQQPPALDEATNAWMSLDSVTSPETAAVPPPLLAMRMAGV
jgi:hypothetical protein